MFAPVTITIGGLKLNNMDNASSITMGPSQHLDILVSYKRNQGVGEQFGDVSPMLFLVSGVFDNDLIDSPSFKASLL